MERRGERMRASGVRMSDAIGRAGDQEGVRGCGAASTIEVAVCVDKGGVRERERERDWRLAEG